MASLKRFFVDKTNIDNGVVTIDGIEHNHLGNVMRLSEGESVIVVCGDGFDYECEITNVMKNKTMAEVISVKQNEYDAKSNVTVFQALVRSDNMSLIVQKLTELGVANLVPFESRFVTSKDKFGKSDKLKAVSEQAVKQCKRSKPINILPVAKFSEVVGMLKNYSTIVFANETESAKSVSEISFDSNDSVAIIVGSEGGFEESEIEELISAGAISVSLGKRILRAETASIALTSIVQHYLGEI